MRFCDARPAHSSDDGAGRELLRIDDCLSLMTILALAAPAAIVGVGDAWKTFGDT